MTAPDRIVFDAEPLIAHADDEPGSKVVEEHLSAVDNGESEGYVSYVTLTEVRYILARKYDEAVADEYLDWVDEIGVTATGVEGVWGTASNIILEYNPALGDAFALGTAIARAAVLLAGADDDYDEIGEPRIQRFRDEPA